MLKLKKIDTTARMMRVARDTKRLKVIPLDTRRVVTGVRSGLDAFSGDSSFISEAMVTRKQCWNTNERVM